MSRLYMGMLSEAIAQLDRREALSIVLVDVVGLTQRELAEVFEVSRSMAWQLHTRAHRKIRKFITRAA